MTSLAAFEDLMDQKRALEEEIKEKAKVVFADTSKSIFEQYGDKVGMFGWTQYTPYFNDGDPCEFGKHELFIYSIEELGSEDEYCDINYYESGDAFNRYSGNLCQEGFKRKDTGEFTAYEFYADKPPVPMINPDYDASYGDPLKAIEKLYDLIDEDTAFALFGDHVVVKVTADGVEVEEYSHD